MNDDDLTTRLGRELHARSDVMHGSSLALADVQRKARSIRHRRSATAAGGAALAVALVVPVAAFLNHHGHTNEPLPAVTRSVTPDPSPSTVDGQQPADGVLDVSHLPAGAAPAIDYVRGRTFHSTDGSTYPVQTRHTPAQFVALDDGSVVWRTVDRNGNPYLEIRDPDGAYHDPVAIASDLSVNPAHSIVAWLTASGQAMVWEGRATEPRPLGTPLTGSELRIGPVTGDDCATACSVIVNVRDDSGAGQPWEVDQTGSQALTDGGYLEVRDQSRDGLTIGLTEARDSSTCSKLLGGGEFTGFRTCRDQLASFSPDGRLIQAWPGYFDGIGPGGIAVYDLDGHRLFQRSATARAQSFYLGETWEDDTHLLVPTYQDGTWAVVRMATDGSMEYAVPPTKGPYEDSPFVLPTGGALPGA